MPNRQHYVVFFNVYTFNPGHEPTTSHTIFAFMIPVLLSLIQIHCSGMDSSPFHFHPAITMASLISLIAYYLAFAATFILPAYASPIGVAMSLFGSFCVASLLCLLPIPWWSVLCLILLVGGFLKLVPQFFGTHGPALWRQPRTAQPLLPLFNVS